jgi:hypothetical protein
LPFCCATCLHMFKDVICFFFFILSCSWCICIGSNFKGLFVLTCLSLCIILLTQTLMGLFERAYGNIFWHCL